MSEQISPLANVPDVHLRVFVRGVRMDFAACVIAAPTFIDRHRLRHYIDAVNVLPGDTGHHLLPTEQLYLSPWDETLTQNVRQRPYGGIGVGNDDQLSLDLGVEVEQTPWDKWVAPERRAAQAQNFMDRAGITRIPSEPWSEDSAEVKRLDTIVAELFPDMATAMDVENADMADAFICFIGECFIRFAGAEWIEYEWFGREHSFYDDVNPALLFDTEDEDEYPAWALMKSMIEYHPEDHDGMFSKMAYTIREYARYREEERNKEV